MTSTNDKDKTKWQILVFLAITFALSALLDYPIFGDIPLSSTTELFHFLIMWCPAAGVFFTMLIYRERFSSLPISSGPVRYLLIAFALPFIYLASVYIFAWLTGLGAYAPDDTSYLQLLTTGLAVSCLFALGEEIGWRGYLVPRLARLYSFPKVALISGIIWSVWHYPATILGDYNQGADVYYSLLCFTLGATAESFAYAWLTLKSRSLWPAVIMHGVHNMLYNHLDSITADTGMTSLFIGEFGIGLVITDLVMAAAFWRLARNFKRDQQGLLIDSQA